MARPSAVLIALMASVVIALTPTEDALACAISIPGDPYDGLRWRVGEATVIIVGQVTAERHGTVDGQPPYISTVRPVATLKDEPPEGGFELSPLGWASPDCSGGPRLPAGERVLLALRHGIQGPTTQMTVMSGAYILRADATYPGLPPPTLHVSPGLAAGTPYPRFPRGEDFVREVAAMVGAPSERTEQAVRSAQGMDLERPAATPSLPPGVTPTSPTFAGMGRVMSILGIVLVGGLAARLVSVLWLRSRSTA